MRSEDRAGDIIARLGLSPHPEGGHYRETFRDPDAPGGRAVSTAIYYLLQAGEVSRWRRIDATEVWHWYAGAAVDLTVSPDGKTTQRLTLGPDFAVGAAPQVVVPARTWQMATSRGPWTLAGCTVAPGFTFDGFEMAPEGWRPG